MIKSNEGTSTFSLSKVEKGLKTNADEFEPGPGQYRYIIENKSKGVTIGERFKEKQVDRAPGPGSYIGLNDWASGYGYSANQSAKFVEMIPLEI